MLFLLFFLSFSEAAFIDSNSRIKHKTISRTASKNELKTSTSNEKLSQSQSHSKLNLRQYPSSDSLKSSTSSPREYIPSAPIRILYSEESLNKLRSDLSKQPKEVDWYQYIEESLSSSSDSSDSSLGGLSIFEMSYDPEYEKLRKMRREERGKQRRIRKELKKKGMRGDTKAATKIESPNLALYYTQEEEEELKDITKERTMRCRYIPNTDLNTDPNYSDLENDSDFGGKGRNEECYSLSF